VVEYVPDQYTKLEAVPAYWKGAPKIKNIILRPSNPDTRQTEILNGELDIARVANWEDKYIKPYQDAGFVFFEVKASMAYYLVFNTDQSVFASEPLRKAVIAALDRPTIITANHERAVTAETLIQPTRKEYPKDSTPYPYDLAEAKRLLAQAGYTDTNGDGLVDKNGQNLKISLRYDNVDDTRLAQIVQDYIKKAGIDIEIIGSDFNTVLSTLRSTDAPFDLAFMGATYRPFPGNGGNHMWMARYTKDAELNALLDKANASGSEAEAIANYGAWGKYLHDRAPIAVLYFKSTGFVVNPKLQGFTRSSMDWFPNVETWYFK